MPVMLFGLVYSRYVIGTAAAAHVSGSPHAWSEPTRLWYYCFRCSGV